MPERVILKISLIIAILGLFDLLVISHFMEAKQVDSYLDLKLNNYVSTTGKISSIRSYDDFSVIKLNNNITIICNCKFKFNESIQAIGKVEEYQKMYQINAEEITRIS